MTSEFLAAILTAILEGDEQRTRELLAQLSREQLQDLANGVG